MTPNQDQRYETTADTGDADREDTGHPFTPDAIATATSDTDGARRALHMRRALQRFGQNDDTAAAHALADGVMRAALRAIAAERAPAQRLARAALFVDGARCPCRCL